MQLNPLSEKYLKASLDQDSWNEAAFGLCNNRFKFKFMWFIPMVSDTNVDIDFFFGSFLHEIFEPFESNGLLHRIEGLERCAVTQVASPR